jgi:hypothetical protein
MKEKKSLQVDPHLPYIYNFYPHGVGSHMVKALHNNFLQILLPATA